MLGQDYPSDCGQVRGSGAGSVKNFALLNPIYRRDIFWGIDL